MCNRRSQTDQDCRVIDKINEALADRLKTNKSGIHVFAKPYFDLNNIIHR